MDRSIIWKKGSVARVWAFLQLNRGGFTDVEISEATGLSLKTVKEAIYKLHKIDCSLRRENKRNEYKKQEIEIC